MREKQKAETLKAEIRRDRDGLTRCRVCGCTEADGCPEGCERVDDDLCSVCGTAADALAAWIYGVRRANKTGLWREAIDKLERETR